MSEVTALDIPASRPKFVTPHIHTNGGLLSSSQADPGAR